MLAVIDYGAGNLRSVLHALRTLGVQELQLVRQPAELQGAHRIILPGVGAFGAGMHILRERGLVAPIREAALAGTPFLGICLGMQFLFDSSDEMGDHEGLHLLPGRVTRFTDQPGLKIPHMGWNQLTPVRQSPLLTGLQHDAYAYFVHSYYCAPQDPADVLLTCDYGGPFCAAVSRGNIFGVQFHPEKSQHTGLRLLANFLEMSA